MRKCFHKPARARVLSVALIVALWTPALLTGALAESRVADAAMRGDVGADVNAPQGDGMTALHWAAVNDAPEMAEMLIYAGAHLEAGTRIGNYTPLHLGSQNGNAAVVATLLEAGSDANVATTTGTVSPLHFAAGNGNAKVVGLLLDHGADVNATDSAWGQTPLMFAAAADRIDAVNLLLQRGADASSAALVVDVVAKEKADNDYMRRRRQEQAAIRALDQRQEEQQRRAEGGGAAGEELGGGEEPEGEEKVEAGADAEGEKKVEAEADAEGEEKAEAEAGDEAEEEAEEEQAAAAEEEIVEEKAVEEEDPLETAETEKAEEETAAEDDKKEPERPATYGERVGGHGGLTALLYAAREGHAETALALLDAGADIDKVSGGDHTSPLLIATLNGHFDLAMALLERGADPNLASEASATPLYGALNVRWAPRSAYPQQNAYKQQETSYLELMTALVEAGADPNIRLSKHLWYTSFNFDHLLKTAGATPFWCAAYALDVDAMRLLVAYGVDPDVPTRKLPRRGRPRPQGEDGKEVEEEDPSGQAPVPGGGPAVYPLHAASGAGYGEGFAGYAHQHVPDGWLPAVKYLVEALGADVNLRDHNAYNSVHHAAARGDFEMVLYLVLAGADPTALSRKGQTTADMANGPVQRIQPFPKAVKLLELLGAKNNHNCVSC